MGIPFQQPGAARGLSQQKVAEAAGTALYATSGTSTACPPPPPRQPNLENLMALAEVLGVDFKDLLPPNPPIGVVPGRT